MMLPEDIGKYNLLVCVTSTGYQVDFIDHKKYSEWYSAMENEGIIVGGVCRSYGVDVNTDRANAKLMELIHELDMQKGVEMTTEEHEEREREVDEL